MKKEPVQIRQVWVRGKSAKEVIPLAHLQNEMENKTTQAIHQILRSVLKSGEFDS